MDSDRKVDSMMNADWLTFRTGDEGIVREWNDRTSTMLSRILDQDIKVELVLPTETDARAAWKENFNLTGLLKFSGTVNGDAEIALPFDGVFLARGSDGIHPNRLVWDNCLVERPGVRLIRPTKEPHTALRWRIGLPNGNVIEAPIRMKIWHTDKNGKRERPQEFKRLSRRLRRAWRELMLAKKICSDLYPSWIWDVLSPSEKGPDIERAEKLLEELHEKIREHLNDLGKFDQDDLDHRVVWSFPKWLQYRLCWRFFVHKDEIDHNKNSRRMVEDLTYGLVPLIGKGTLDRTAGDLVYVFPENPIELISRIYGIKRFPVSREQAVDFPAEYRQNHPSFERRICPLESPESELVGLALQLARGARIDSQGSIIAAKEDENGGCQPFFSWGASLIPFLHHNDGARNMMGAKNLRQVLPVEGRHSPCVRSGGERGLVARMSGLMDVGICPDYRVKGGSTDKTETLALGCDLLVAYMPWYGWNVDDAIVVSRTICEKMTTVKRKVFSRFLNPGWKILGEESWTMGEDGRLCLNKCLHEGDEIVTIVYGEGASQESETIRYCDFGEGNVELKLSAPLSCQKGTQNVSCSRRLEYVIERRFKLGLGDKLMGRHGNKGVVAKILDEEDMPWFEDENGDKRRVEVLLNPHGVLSRMNPGQLLETHLGWLIANGKWASSDDGYPQVGRIDHGKVRDLLQKTGLSRSGAIGLHWKRDEKNVASIKPIVIGYQHFVRLDHVPELKAQARRGGRSSRYDLLSCQASQGRRVGGGQRVGEMEMWALRAHMAETVIDEMIGVKSDAVQVKNVCSGYNVLEKALQGFVLSPLDGGFGRQLRDWLRAMLIDLRYDPEKKVLKLRRMRCDTPQSLETEFGNSKIKVSKVTIGEACFSHAEFKCDVGCKDGFPFGYEFHQVKKGREKKTYLYLKDLLDEFGLKLEGRLREASEGKYVQDLSYKNGSVPAGSLDVEPISRTESATNLVLRISTSEVSREIRDKGFKDFYCVREYKEQGNRVTSSALLRRLCDQNGVSLGDCRVSCPKHKARALVLVNTENNADDGGLQSCAVFGECEDIWGNVSTEKWGYIELPVKISGEKLCKKLLGDTKYTGPDFDLAALPVLPRRYRMPISLENREGKSASIFDVKGYGPILGACKNFDKALEEKDKSKCKGEIEKAVCELFKLLKQELVAKLGLLRHEGLGRRVDRAFRLVITPDPTLKVDECRVPADVLCEILGEQKRGTEKPCVAKKSCNVSTGWSWRADGRKHDVAGTIKKVLDLTSLQNSDLKIILNRQPSLHRDSILAFKPKPMFADKDTGVFPAVLMLPPLACKCFAADFDGDEMVGHATCNIEGNAQEELNRMTLVDNVLSIDGYSPNENGTCFLTYNHDRDLVSGLYLLGKGCKAEQEKMLIGMCTQDSASHPVEKLAVEAWKACTENGCSFGFYDLLDLQDPDPNRVPSGDNDSLDKQAKARVDRPVDSGVKTIVLSGANGESQLRQYLVARGNLLPGKLGYDPDINRDVQNCGNNHNGKLGDFFKCTLVGGMSWEEMFGSSKNARSSMCDKKLGTALAGDLTRKLVFALQHLKVVEEDCGNQESRSVLDCKSRDGVCQKCYGRLPDGTEPPIGFPAGLIAALSIGERGTQLSMKSAHTSGGRNDFKGVRDLIYRGKVSDCCEKTKDWNEFYDRVKKLAPDYEKVSTRHFELLWRRLLDLHGSLFDEYGHFVACPFDLDTVVFGLSDQNRSLAKFLASDRDAELSLKDSPSARVLFGRLNEKEDC